MHLQKNSTEKRIYSIEKYSPYIRLRIYIYTKKHTAFKPCARNIEFPEGNEMVKIDLTAKSTLVALVENPKQVIVLGTRKVASI